MIVIRFAALVVAVMTLYATHLNLKRKVFNKIEFAVWSGVWLCLLLVSIAPGAVYSLLGAFGTGLLGDLIMIIAFVIIYLVGFYVYILARKQQIAVEQVVREMAILGRDLK